MNWCVGRSGQRLQPLAKSPSASFIEQRSVHAPRQIEESARVGIDFLSREPQTQEQQARDSRIKEFVPDLAGKLDYRENIAYTKTRAYWEIGSLVILSKGA